MMHTISYFVLASIIVMLLLVLIHVSKRADRFEDELEYAIEVNTTLVNQNVRLRRHKRVLTYALESAAPRAEDLHNVDMPIPFTLVDKVEHFN